MLGESLPMPSGADVNGICPQCQMVADVNKVSASDVE